MLPAERHHHLVLSLAPGLGPTLTQRCLDTLESPEAVVHAPVETLAQVQGIGLMRAQAIRRGLDELLQGDRVAKEEAMLAAHGVTLLVPADADYPALLRHVPDPPPLLYVRGTLQPTDQLALAVVGARKCSTYGREQADRLAGQCAAAGLTIVSGGAYGIDAAAHRAAIRAGGRTIVVLGNGLAEPYPREHRELFDQVADGHGAVLSELPMMTPPSPENFPRRNRIISGLSLGVLVIEASFRSGALITARLAAEEHHREVMALPGRVDSPASQGCHKILREGWASLVTSPAEVLDALGETGTLLQGALEAHTAVTGDSAGVPAPTAPSLFEQNLSPSQAKILASLAEHRTLDQLAAGTGLAVHQIQADLTLLQIRSLVSRHDGQYQRVSRGAS